MPPLPTLLVTDDACLVHDTGSHPECAARVVRVRMLLDRAIETPLLSHVRRGEGRKATREEIEAVHSAEYVSLVQRACASGGGALDPDTVVSPASYDAALAAAGGLLEACDAVMERRASSAFALVRPPGHHALHDRAMGFCLFNNVAVATRYLQRRHGLRRIAILDWDVHHGNGTQQAFYSDPDVLFVSWHRWPFYPGTGAAEEIGEGRARQTTINRPLPADTPSTRYRDDFAAILEGRVRDFGPEAILISAGFDAYRHDPIGGLNLAMSDYAELTRCVKEAADKACEGRIISVLEGGYNLSYLPFCVLAHLAGLRGEESARSLERMLPEDGGPC